ncbi:bacterioferritin, iron storage and detoxification protein (modular protein) [Cupriavidus taiwanensis]|uniref:Bacterial ferritin n=1 Tax=Cupriavidus taiwanensis TaxID=164546 RepID=A0A7Z7JIY7_9BURK|nr:bacterioferritin, iron storage and detoxification protein (modular protein) [Cupriavidus taiwanensis]SOZ96252.1 bacterioferritin, iron storage and detoxification protein (modular protein) [Cupriavidus taiwanensis]SPC25782.1 bacterioferritin, iron storage and detoxification protein (modular protein) [Cupriavidus taiwanensis]
MKTKIRGICDTPSSHRENLELCLRNITLPIAGAHSRAWFSGVNIVKTDKKVILLLNGELKNELTAINQYFLHARMYKHWGLNELGKHEYEESIEEMKHADRLIERILLLDGLPNLQDLGKLLVGENVEEMLGGDLKLELASQSECKEAIKYFESVGDYVSREIVEDILDDTETHIDWLTTRLELVKKVGLQNFLQSAMGSLS